MIIPRSMISVLLAAVLLASASQAATAPAPHVWISQGELVGVRQGPVDSYLGIPYAAPPVGPNRWRSPQPAPHWRGIRSANHFGASCYQVVTPNGFGPWTREYVVTGSVSENCLFLNVWTPATDGRKRPVLVWIHGGAFISGSGSVPIYDGTSLATQGIVVVTLNYRLGVFGFLAYPALTAEAQRAGEPPGNFGLQDMIAALQWLHRNVAAFGGDPNAITIAGQSAGAISVHELVASPLARGLFARAIAESGFPNTVPTPSLREAERAGEAFAHSKGADSLAALRALPAKDLVSASITSKPWFTPIVDGTVLPASPERLLQEGRFSATPILIGVNADERSGFSAPPGPVGPRAWKQFLQKTFGAAAPRFAHLYPANDDAQRSEAIRLLGRDLGLTTLYSWAKVRLSHAKSPVYAYLWTHIEPGPQSFRWGAFHSSEIPYVFRTLDKSPARHFTAADRAISIRISDYWIDFIKTGSPNGPGLAVWPELRIPEMRIMDLDTAMTPVPILPPRVLQAMKEFMAQGGTPNLF